MQRYNPMTKCLETVKTADSKKKRTMDFDRVYYQDKYNKDKVWEITKQSGGNYYVKQFIKGKQFGKGTRMSKSDVDDLGLGKIVKSPTADRKTVDAFSLYDLRNAGGESQRVQIFNKNYAEVFGGTVGEALKDKRFAGKRYKMLPMQHGIAKFVMLDRKTVDSKTFYSVTYYVMGRGRETKFFDNPNDAMKFYNKADRADKPKKLTYSNPQKIKELEEYIREQNAYSRYY